MLLGNETPFAALGFGDRHRDGLTMAVVSVRASYTLLADGTLQLANQQEIVFSDVYEGDPHRTPLLRVGDLASYKPATDVTLLGMAHAPGGKPTPSWEVGLSVGARRVALRVHGPRQWEPTLRRLKPSWKLGAAEAVIQVPLDYRLASGGRFAGDPEGEASANNPIGPGYLHRDWSPVGKRLRAPQIEAADAPLDDPFATPPPAGFGPIPPFWRMRERHCGTRDEDWQRNRCPDMPHDFDYRFFQSAHPDLVWPRLAGNEVVRLDGLVPGSGALAFALPGVVPVVHHAWFDGRAATARLMLDGLHLDLRAADGPWTVDLTWRGWATRCPNYHGAHLALVPLAEASDLPISGEFGLAEAEGEVTSVASPETVA